MATRTSTNAKLSQCGFHHMALRATDYEKSLAFYRDGLGFPVAHSWGEGAGRIALLELGDGNYLELFASEEGWKPEAGNQFFHLALRSTDVDADIEHVRALGCPITIEPKSVPVNGKTIRVGFFLGPDGETLEFFYNDEL
jgi:catechol 2,3-dioxygenase-like lactoylglutathione lyase family enzyme